VSEARAAIDRQEESPDALRKLLANLLKVHEDLLEQGRTPSPLRLSKSSSGGKSSRARAQSQPPPPHEQEPPSLPPVTIVASSKVPEGRSIGSTPGGRPVYGWWCGGFASFMSTSYWYHAAGLTAAAVDSKARGPGGSFLFTHQGDDGMLFWYPEGKYRGAHAGAWQSEGKGIAVHAFGVGGVYRGRDL